VGVEHLLRVRGNRFPGLVCPRAKPHRLSFAYSAARGVGKLALVVEPTFASLRYVRRRRLRSDRRPRNCHTIAVRGWC
jgi:hypothetical protein